MSGPYAGPKERRIKMEIKVTELAITIIYFAACILIGVSFTKRAGKWEKEYWARGRMFHGG